MTGLKLNITHIIIVINMSDINKSKTCVKKIFVNKERYRMKAM